MNRHIHPDLLRLSSPDLLRQNGFSEETIATLQMVDQAIAETHASPAYRQQQMDDLLAKVDNHLAQTDGCIAAMNAAAAGIEDAVGILA